MPLAETGELIHAAAARGSAVAAFNVIQLEHAEAVVAGAAQVGASVILQISQNAVRFHGALDPIATATLEVARAADIPVAVHLDQVTDVDLALHAVELGLGSLLVDAAALPPEDRLSVTAELVAHCHRHGVWVEASCPSPAGDPADAASFVAETGVDALALPAVSVSSTATSSPGRSIGVDLPMVERLRRSVRVPLVLHGVGGATDAALVAAVRRGVTKVALASHLDRSYTRAVRDYLAADPQTVDPSGYLAAVRSAVTSEVLRLLAVLATAERPVGGRSG